MAIFSLTDTGAGDFGNPREFRCTGGEIFMLDALCDGFNNCTSGEDERSIICESKLFPDLPSAKHESTSLRIFFLTEDNAYVPREPGIFAILGLRCAK